MSSLSDITRRNGEPTSNRGTIIAYTYTLGTMFHIIFLKHFILIIILYDFHLKTDNQYLVNIYLDIHVHVNIVLNLYNTHDLSDCSDKFIPRFNLTT